MASLAEPVPDKNYRHYVLGVLTLTYFMNFTDRQVLSVLLEDIRLEFALSDTQLGLLSGFAFAIFYSTLGIPIARLADRTNRVRIVAGAAALWSVATAMCGFAANFVQLFVARVAVGVGEAGCAPPTMSVLADYYRKSELSRALGVLTGAAHLGALAGVVIGGLVAEAYGWRYAFLVVGLPGLAIAALIRSTVREPERGRLTEGSAEDKARPPFRETVSRLLRNRIFLFVAFGHALAVTMAYVTANWGIVLYRRVFDVGAAEVGIYFAIAVLLGSAPGTILGGVLSDRLIRRDPRWQCWLPAIGMTASFPLLVIAPFAATVWPAAILFTGAFFLKNLALAPAAAMMQSVVRPGERAVAASVFIFLSSGLGIGVGPTLVGVISDGFAPAYGEDSLRYAISIMSVTVLLGAVMFMFGGRALGRSEPVPA